MTYLSNQVGDISGQKLRACWLKCSLALTAVLNTKRRITHLVKAFYSCWHLMFLCFCPTQRFLCLCVFCSCVEISREYFAVHVARFALPWCWRWFCYFFVSLCLCVSVARIRDREGEGYCSFSGMKRPQRVGTSCFFLHIFFWLTVPISLHLHWAFPLISDNKSSEYEHRQLFTKNRNCSVKSVSLKLPQKLRSCESEIALTSQ